MCCLSCFWQSVLLYLEWCITSTAWSWSFTVVTSVCVHMFVWFGFFGPRVFLFFCSLFSVIPNIILCCLVSWWMPWDIFPTFSLFVYKFFFSFLWLIIWTHRVLYSRRGVSVMHAAVSLLDHAQCPLPFQEVAFHLFRQLHFIFKALIYSWVSWSDGGPEMILHKILSLICGSPGKYCTFHVLTWDCTSESLTPERDGGVSFQKIWWWQSICSTPQISICRMLMVQDGGY